MVDKTETMAWERGSPWEKVGHEVDGLKTADQWAKAAGLDYEIKRGRMQFVDKDTNKVHAAPGRYCMYRSTDQRPITYAGQGWKPVQPRDVVKFMHDYARKGGIVMKALGQLRNCQIIWGYGELKHNHDITRGDNVGGGLLFLSPNVVGNSTRIATMSFRRLCSNTLNISMLGMGDTQYKQNHMTEFKFEIAAERVEMANDELAAFIRRAKQIAKLKLSANDFARKVLVPVFEKRLEEDKVASKKILDPEFTTKRIQQIMSAYEHAPGASPGNGWGALNAVTYWADHMQGNRPDSRLFRAWVGDYARSKRQVEQKLYEMAN